MLGRLATELDAKDVEMGAATGALQSLAAGERAVGRCGQDGAVEALLCSPEVPALQARTSREESRAHT